jgi:hypothetical protein
VSGKDSAFPTQMWDEELKEATWLDGGLTKRELFAAMAMQGCMAANGKGELTLEEIDQMAVGFVTVADALLAELAKGDAETREAIARVGGGENAKG